MLLGSGELGKEFTIAAKRAGQYVIACDKYDNAPAMQVGEDGKLYPPMAAKVKGKFVEPIELGKWEQADERPEHCRYSMTLTFAVCYMTKNLACI